MWERDGERESRDERERADEGAANERERERAVERERELLTINSGWSVTQLYNLILSSFQRIDYIFI